jgi:hypothetical protein
VCALAERAIERTDDERMRHILLAGHGEMVLVGPCSGETRAPCSGWQGPLSWAACVRHSSLAAVQRPLKP